MRTTLVHFTALDEAPSPARHRGTRREKAEVTGMFERQAREGEGHKRKEDGLSGDSVGRGEEGKERKAG